MVESIGESYRLGGRCAWGEREGMKSVRTWVMNDELDMATLVWTRGAHFPIARLESRMKCPESR
jgi:hypothetical protein